MAVEKGAVQSSPATCGGFVHSVLPGDHHTASFGISAAASAPSSIVKSSTRSLKLTSLTSLLTKVHAGRSDTPVLTAPELFASGHAMPPAARHAGSTSTVSTSCVASMRRASKQKSLAFVTAQTLPFSVSRYAERK